jgi:hypothetical protein
MSNNDSEFDVANIIEYLSLKLPDYMIPAYFFKLEDIHLTPNGKIDKKKLPDPKEILDVGVEYAPPRNQTEEILVETWKKELGLERVGINDNYFSIGGDSIKSIMLVSIINEKLGKHLKIVDLYVHNTIEKLASWIDREESATDETHQEVLSEIDDLKHRILSEG